MNFGKFYEKKLNEKKLKKIEVAKRLGITRQSLSSNISRWKAGGEPATKTIKKYLDVIGISLNEYLNFLNNQ